MSLTSTPPIPDVVLNNGVAIPQLGFGVFLVPPSETERTVALAFEAGYRSIDTATGYANEQGVGNALAASGLARDEVFITTKLQNPDHGYDRALQAFDLSLDLLGLEVVDLYLIHWPTPARDLYVETWRALEHIAAEGKARAIGVSNFQPSHLQRLVEECEIVPAVNQIELHPYLQQDGLRAFHAEHGIATEAWSPLAKGEALTDPTIVAIADRHHRTPAQVVLRWQLELGNIVIPKSVTPERISANLDVFDFELTGDDLAEIGALERDHRTGPQPDTFN